MTSATFPPETEILLYTAPDGMVKIDVLYQKETFLLSQKKMAALFGVQVPAIAKHLKNIFETGELQEQAVVSILEIPAADGKVYATQFYNLDAFLRFNDYAVLDNAGKIKADVAKALADKEYEHFRVLQDKTHVSDFDRLIQRTNDKTLSPKEEE